MNDIKPDTTKNSTATAILREVFELSLEGILLIDYTGTIIKANPACHEMYGYDEGELLQQNIESLVPEELREEHKNRRDNYLKRPAVKVLGRNRELFGRKKDGTTFPLEVRVCPTVSDGHEAILHFIVDVSAQRALMEREQRYDETQSVAHIGSWYWNMQTGERTWSDEFYRICGLPPKDARLNGDTLLELIHPEDRESTLQAVQHSIENKIQYTNEKRFLRPDGTVRHVLSKGKTSYDDKGKALYMLGTIQDLTEQVELEQSLKQEELFVSNIGSILEMIIHRKPIKTLGNQIIEVLEQVIPDSRASILLLNKEKGTLHCLAAPHLPDAFTKVIEGLSIGPKIGSCGTAAYTKKAVITTDIAKDPRWKNHSEVALENNLRACWSFPLISSNNEVLGTFAIYSGKPRKPGDSDSGLLKDIIRVASIALEQHQSSLALKESQAQLKLHTQQLEGKVLERTMELNDMVQGLVEANSDLEDQMVATDMAEYKARMSKRLLSNIARHFPKGLIIVVNKDFEFDFAEGEALSAMGLEGVISEGTSMNDIDFLSEDEKALRKENVKKTIKGEHLTFELMRNGRAYLVNTTPLKNEDGNISQALFVFNDISEQKLVEEEVMRTLEKERDLSELKSRFVAMASHEFRTPLSVILSSALLIEKQNGLGKEEKRLDNVERIRSNVKNLVVILNDFLSLSKLEEGIIEVQASKFDLLDLSRIVIEEIGTAKKVGQKIRLETTSETLDVFLDRKLMQHILQNLLTNAIKYSPENKDIVMRVEKDDHRLLIEVIDQGIGIPEAEQDKMFQRFFRAENSTNIQGTGLGLVIVKQYVELMGGTISFTSVLGQGSTFAIELLQN